MSMMRRGPLDRYSAEWVLKQADAHQASGCIEFHGSVPLTVHLAGGLIHGAVLGIHQDPEPVIDHLSEEGARLATVAVVACALRLDSGWYFHDPLGGPREPGAWGWDVPALLAEARTSRVDRASAGRLPEVDLALRRSPTGEAVTLTPDAWAIVVSLAAPASLSDVRSRLGWPPDRLVHALDDLRRIEALAVTGPATEPVPGPAPGHDARSVPPRR